MMVNVGKKIKIGFLIIDYVPHQVNSIRAFIETEGAEVTAFHAALFVKTVPDFPNFNTSLYSNFSKKQILDRMIHFNPDVLIVAGWMIKEYVWVAKKIRQKLGIPVVALSDTQWNNTIKQKINALISPFYLKRVFSHIWVAGLYQYEYARKLGFDKNKILLNSLTADVDFFSKVNLDEKKNNYPKRILYIGRFSPEKGLDTLLDSWSEINEKNGWTMTLVGKGDYRHSYLGDKSVERFDYMDANGLRDLMQNSGAFVLPSNYEPWALVIHEAAAAGLPIIATDVCGAVPHFVMNNYNGYIPNPETASLKEKIAKLIYLEDADLIEMAHRSRVLAREITIEKHTKSLMQIL